MAIGIAIIIFLVFKTVNAVQVMTGKQTAKAIVISTNDEVRESNERAGMVTVTVYSFIVNDNEYYGRTEVSQGSLSEGDQLTIKYNANDPTKNRVAGDRSVIGDWLLFVMLGGVAAYLLIGAAIGFLKPFRARKMNE